MNAGDGAVAVTIAAAITVTTIATSFSTCSVTAPAMRITEHQLRVDDRRRRGCRGLTRSAVQHSRAPRGAPLQDAAPATGLDGVREERP